MAGKLAELPDAQAGSLSKKFGLPVEQVQCLHKHFYALQKPNAKGKRAGTVTAEEVRSAAAGGGAGAAVDCAFKNCFKLKSGKCTLDGKDGFLSGIAGFSKTQKLDDRLARLFKALVSAGSGRKGKIDSPKTLATLLEQVTNEKLSAEAAKSAFQAINDGKPVDLASFVAFIKQEMPEADEQVSVDPVGLSSGASKEDEEVREGLVRVTLPAVIPPLTLGISLAPVEGGQGVYVDNLSEDGAAKKSGNVRVGDYVVAVGGQGIAFMDTEGAVGVLREATKTELVLTLLRRNSGK